MNRQRQHLFDLQRAAHLRRRLVCGLATVAAIGFVTPDVFAAKRAPGDPRGTTYVWTNLAGDYNWENPQNWDPNPTTEPPYPNHFDHVVFDGATSSDDCVLNQNHQCWTITLQADYAGSVHTAPNESLALDVADHAQVDGGTLQISELTIGDEGPNEGGSIHVNGGFVNPNTSLTRRFYCYGNVEVSAGQMSTYPGYVYGNQHDGLAGNVTVTGDGDGWDYSAYQGTIDGSLSVTNGNCALNSVPIAGDVTAANATLNFGGVTVGEDGATNPMVLTDVAFSVPGGTTTVWPPITAQNTSISIGSTVAAFKSDVHMTGGSFQLPSSGHWGTADFRGDVILDNVAFPMPAASGRVTLSGSRSTQTLQISGGETLDVGYFSVSGGTNKVVHIYGDVQCRYGNLANTTHTIIHDNFTLAPTGGAAFEVENHAVLEVADGGTFVHDDTNGNLFNFRNITGQLVETGSGKIVNRAEVGFVDADGLPLGDITPGDLLYVQLKDADENVDGTILDEVTVTVQNTINGDSVDVILTQVAQDDYFYFNNVVSGNGIPTEDAAANPGDGILQFSAGDTLKVSYTDAQDSGDYAERYFPEAPFVWVCDGSIDNNWHTPQNWDRGTVPTQYDNVLFDGTSVEDCFIPNTPRCECRELTATSAYTRAIYNGSSRGVLWAFYRITMTGTTVNGVEQIAVMGTGGITLDGCDVFTTDLTSHGPTNFDNGTVIHIAQLDAYDDVTLSNGSVFTHNQANNNYRWIFVRGDLRIESGSAWTSDYVLEMYGPDAGVGLLSVDADASFQPRYLRAYDTTITGHVHIQDYEADGWFMVRNNNTCTLQNATITFDDLARFLGAWDSGATLIVDADSVIDARNASAYGNQGLIVEEGVIYRDSSGFFCDAAGEPIFSFSPGDTLYLTLVDEDENLDGQTLETLVGEVLVETGGDAEWIDVTEVENGTFLNAGLPTSNGPPIPGDGELQYDGISNITFSYTDSEDAVDSIVIDLLLPPKIWDGEGNDNSWFTPENWTGDTVPSRADSVIFNDTSTKDCEVGASIEVNNLTIEAGYTGRIVASAGTAQIHGDCSLNDPDAVFSYWDASTVEVHGNLHVNAGFYYTGDSVTHGSVYASGVDARATSLYWTFHGPVVVDDDANFTGASYTFNDSLTVYSGRYRSGHTEFRGTVELIDGELETVGTTDCYGPVILRGGVCKIGSDNRYYVYFHNGSSFERNGGVWDTLPFMVVRTSMDFGAGPLGIDVLRIDTWQAPEDTIVNIHGEVRIADPGGMFLVRGGADNNLPVTVNLMPGSLVQFTEFGGSFRVFENATLNVQDGARLVTHKANTYENFGTINQIEFGLVERWAISMGLTEDDGVTPKYRIDLDGGSHANLLLFDEDQNADALSFETVTVTLTNLNTVPPIDVEGEWPDERETVTLTEKALMSESFYTGVDWPNPGDLGFPTAFNENGTEGDGILQGVIGDVSEIRYVDPQHPEDILVIYRAMTLYDCNQNGVDDETDIAGGTSEDCDNNGVPDECQLPTDQGGFGQRAHDCNDDGIVDLCQLIGNDCQPNGIPDDCELDSDGDGVPDDCDICNGYDDLLDADGDGIPDDCDACPNTPAGEEPDEQGCSCSQLDDDGDGVNNCDDQCPTTPAGLGGDPGFDPGTGCHCSELDSDGDTVNDCDDVCPGEDDTLDADNDGTPDGCDDCPNDPNKTEPGQCGCGTPDTDTDGDGVADCNDNCITVGNPDQADCDDDGIGDACEGEPDCNANSVPDSCDIADGTSNDVNTNGIPDECEDANGACCIDDGGVITCEMAIDETDCTVTHGGEWAGDGTTCDDLDGDGVADDCEPEKLIIEPAADCFSDQLVVHIVARDVGQYYAGGQFALSFDTSLLTVVSAEAGDGLWTELYEVLNQADGEIDYAVNAPYGEPGTDLDSVMAVITFAIEPGYDGACEVADLVSFRPHDPPTRLTSPDGDAIYATEIDLAPVSIDQTPPVVSDVEVVGAMVDAGCEATVSFSGVVTDNCCVPESNVVLDVVVATGNADLGTPDITLTPNGTNGFDVSGTVLVSNLQNCPATVQCTIFALDCCGNAAGTPTSPPLTGRFSESYAGGGPGLPGQTAHGGSWDGSTLYTQWEVRDSELVTFELLEDNVDPWGKGDVISAATYTGGILTIDSALWGAGGFVTADVVDWRYVIYSPHVDGVPGNLRAEASIHARVSGELGLSVLVRSEQTGGGTDLPSDYPSFLGGATEGLWGDIVDISITTLTSATGDVTDIEAPVINDCPADIVVNADAGQSSAVVTWVPPTASDNCGVASLVSTHSPGDTFPLGTTTVTYTATDTCGNTAECSFDVTVEANNTLEVVVELQGVHVTEVDRCITFELWSCDGTPTYETIQSVITFTSDGSTNAIGTANVDIPIGEWECITARDTLHTLRRTDEAFHIDGARYVADFTGDPEAGGDWLIGGNFNDDFWVDILDYGMFTWQWNTDYGTGDCTCSTSAPHADASGDGLVTPADFTFIQTNFWVGYEANCCGQTGLADRKNGPRKSVTLEELEEMGLSDLAVADLNGDGRLDMKDVRAFANGVRPTPAKKSLTPARSKR